MVHSQNTGERFPEIKCIYLCILTTSLQGTYTPFLSRPISSFQRCHTLNDNCVV
ncbi:unnamed protein product, partial [Staurois parvus]